MKKVLSVSLVGAMALSLIACGNKAAAPAETTAAPAATEAATEAAAETEAETEAEAEAPAETYDLIWAGTSSSSGYYALNVALCDVINSYVDGVTVTLMETGGTVDDYKLMSTGEASFGQTSNVNEYCLQENIAAYEDFGYTGARDMMFFVPQVYRFVVTADSGIETVQDLNGQKYNAGLQGSSSELESMNILGTIGVEPDWYPAGTADAVDAISNRQIIGFTKSGSALSADSTITNLMANVDVKFLSFTDEEVAKIQEKFPYYGFETAGTEVYGKDYDTTTYCSRFGFCVDESLPEDVVYNIVKAFDEHHDEIKAAYPGIVDDPLDLTAGDASISKMHPGAVKYLEEKGYTVSDIRK